jgi:hypothetical protein
MDGTRTARAQSALLKPVLLTPGQKAISFAINIIFQETRFVLLQLALNMFSNPSTLIAMTIGKLVKHKGKSI